MRVIALLTALALAAAELASAGLLHRRAGLTTAKILEELTNVNGRNFCHDYIGAQVLVLNDYFTVMETKVISKVINTKVTATSTETIGTLRKGTSTTTVLHTVTSGAGITETIGPTITTTITSTVTGAFTTTTYAEARRKRKRALALPSILSDSDPLNVSAACTKIINKYPIYTTASSATTKSTTTTTTATSTSIVLKIQKVTQIDPYVIKTVSSAIRTVGDNSTVTTISVNQFRTVTTTQTVGPTSTVTFPEDCKVNSSGKLLRPSEGQIRHKFPIRDLPNSDNTVIIDMGFISAQECCQACSRQIGKWGERSCQGFMIRNNGGECSYIVQYHDKAPHYDEPSTCPAQELGLFMATDVLPPHFSVDQRDEFWTGPCNGGVRKCYEDWDTCFNGNTWWP